MKFEVMHEDLTTPVEIEDREQYKNDWKSIFDNTLIDGKLPEDETERKKLSEYFNKKEKELLKRYPAKKIWEISSLGDLLAKIDRFESLAICKNGSKYEIYVYNLSNSATKAEASKIDSTSGNNGELSETSGRTSSEKLSSQLDSKED